MQCGAACLAMVCHYYNSSVSISDIEKFCHITSEGVSLKGIKDAAEELGLNAVPLKIRIDSLVNITTPTILHWDQNHYVVLYKVDRNGNRFWIADPGKGKYKLSLNPTFTP